MVDSPVSLPIREVWRVVSPRGLAGGRRIPKLVKVSES